MNTLPIGARVIYRLSDEPFVGRIASATPGKTYTGPRTGPYRVQPVPNIQYQVQADNGDVRRFVHTEGHPCPLNLEDDA